MTQMTVFVDKGVKKSYHAYIHIFKKTEERQHVEINAWKI